MIFVATVPSSDVLTSFGRRVTVACLSTISKVGRPSSTVLISHVTGVVPVDFVLKNTSIEVIHAPSGPTKNDCANGSLFLLLRLLRLLLRRILLRKLRVLLLLFLSSPSTNTTDLTPNSSRGVPTSRYWSWWRLVAALVEVAAVQKR